MLLKKFLDNLLLAQYNIIIEIKKEAKKAYWTNQDSFLEGSNQFILRSPQLLRDGKSGVSINPISKGELTRGVKNKTIEQ